VAAADHADRCCKAAQRLLRRADEVHVTQRASPAAAIRACLWHRRKRRVQPVLGDHRGEGGYR
jgi:hypothetical protein